MGSVIKKSETITVRIAPAVKQGLKDAAEREHRSQANMVEVMIREYCKERGVTIEGSRTGKQYSK